jgi:hypothetical protein
MKLISQEIAHLLNYGWMKTADGYVMLDGCYKQWVKEQNPNEWTHNPITDTYIMSDSLEMIFLLRWS